MAAVELHPRQIDAAETIGTMHVERPLGKNRVGGRDAEAGEPRRIEQADQ